MRNQQQTGQIWAKQQMFNFNFNIEILKLNIKWYKNPKKSINTNQKGKNELWFNSVKFSLMFYNYNHTTKVELDSPTNTSTTNTT
jgi:hypothetical protein